MIVTKTLEMGGIYREDFIKYFLSIGGKTENQEVFKGPYWEVEVGYEVWSMMGSLKLHHTLITFHVEEDKFEEFISKFRLNFLRCGG